MSSNDTNLKVGSWCSTFAVPKMDCPSEEAIIKMQLDSIEPKPALDIDIPNRKVRVFHACSSSEIEQHMADCNLGAVLERSEPISQQTWNQSLPNNTGADNSEENILKTLLAINGVMFLFELVLGWIAQSTGLIADSIDMFADAAVYAVALIAVGQSARKKLHAAHLSGWLQLILAFGVLVEVMRRFLFGSDPISMLMMGIGAIALFANVTCLFLIIKKKDSGAHMRASYIFSANDVIANFGVIVAGVLVAWTGSRYPDLVIGLIIAVVVFSGAIRILRIRN